MITIAERPAAERRAWQAFFDHYVFRSNGPSTGPPAPAATRVAGAAETRQLLEDPCAHHASAEGRRRLVLAVAGNDALSELLAA